MLTLAGIPTVAFAAVMVLAAIASGNPAAADGSLAGAAIAVGVVACVVSALRSPRGRVRLELAAAWLLRLLQRIVRRLRVDPGVVVRGAMDRVSGVHVTLATVGVRVSCGRF